jgi:hypothetical protein
MAGKASTIIDPRQAGRDTLTNLRAPKGKTQQGSAAPCLGEAAVKPAAAG